VLESSTIISINAVYRLKGFIHHDDTAFLVLNVLYVI